MSTPDIANFIKAGGGLNLEGNLHIDMQSCSLPLPTRVAFIGNHLPRQCGIATFTTDLCNALETEYGIGRLFIIPVNDPDSHYDYPEQVRLELEQEDLTTYDQAAEFLNFNGNDLVCLQHEYGVYGGIAGDHILALLRKLNMPVVTTFHTVLKEPDPDQRRVLEGIARLSDRLIVMSEQAAQFLREVYAIPGGKIDVIPHGVPDFQFMDPNFFKDRFGAEGNSVLLTFGLLSPNKGIENVIRALPAIRAKHANVVYIVSGVTHPHIRRRDGERYREELEALAAELGVSANLMMVNRFVSAEELVEHIGAADIYITPYLFRSMTQRHLRARFSDFWAAMQSAMRCGSAPICIPARRSGPRRRESTWRVFSGRASNARCSRVRRGITRTRRSIPANYRSLKQLTCCG